MIKKYQIYLNLVLILFLGITIVPTKASSATVTDGMIKALEPVSLPQVEDNETEEQLIGQIIQFFLSIFGIIFLALMLYGGYVYMKAQGREEEVDRGKKIIQAAVIGIIIAFLAYSITFFILSRLPRAGEVGGNPATDTNDTTGDTRKEAVYS